MNYVKEILEKRDEFDGRTVNIQAQLYSGGDDISFIVSLDTLDDTSERLDIRDPNFFSGLSKSCEPLYGGRWLYCAECEIKGQVGLDGESVYLHNISDLIYIQAEGKLRYIVSFGEHAKSFDHNFPIKQAGEKINIQGCFRLIGSKADVASSKDAESGIVILQEDIVDIVECNFFGADDDDNYIEQVTLIADVVEFDTGLAISKIHEIFVDYGHVILNIKGKGRL